MPFELLVQVIAMVSVVFAAAWVTTVLMRRRSAASRHAVWSAALLVALVLPVAAHYGPSWELRLLTPSGDLPVAAPRVDLAPSASGDVTAADDSRAEPDSARDVVTDVTPASVAFNEPRVEPSGGSGETVSSLSPALALAIAWAVGFTVWLVRLVAGLARSRWIARRGERVTDAAWAASLADAAARLGLRSPVTLRFSWQATMPAVHGFWRATLLLPAGAAAWTPERRRVVLLHELAHVLRRDVAVQLLARVVSALHWFNPLAHVAVRQLRIEQERACDDVVLTCGPTGPEYADHLVEIARDFRPSLAGAEGWGTVGMARPSQLETRLRAILDPGANRRGLSALSRGLLVASVMAVALPLGTLRVTAAAAPQVDARAVARAPVPVPASPGSAAIAPRPVTHEAAVEPGSAGVPTRVVRAETPLVAAVQAATAQSQTDDTQRRAVAALAMAVKDEDENVRLHAVQALAGLGGSEAVDALTQALKDTSPDVRAEAAQALGAIAHRAADRQNAQASVQRAREEAAREQDVTARLREFERRVQSEAEQRARASDTAEMLRQQATQSTEQRRALEDLLREMQMELERARMQIADAERRLEEERQRRERAAAESQR